MVSTRRALLRGALAGVAGAVSLPARSEEAPRVAFTAAKGRLQIRVGGKPFTDYVYEDAAIPRPYFTALREPGGAQVTRNHPPVPGKDAVDHDTLHPGAWLAFGDVSGVDFWRNKAQVEHAGFQKEPRGGRGEGRFTVLRHWLKPDGSLLMRETCRIGIIPRKGQTLLAVRSEFTPEVDVVFGDQEEMGFGMRVATPIAVANGGEMVSSEGKRGEKAIRGTQALWVDYRGVVDGRRVGICLMPDPANFRPSWWHARDYGFIAANPFGRNALTGGEKSAVTRRKGETLVLGYGVAAHGSDTDMDGAYENYVYLTKPAD